MNDQEELAEGIAHTEDSFRPGLWRKIALKLFPFLFKECPFSSKHWVWERLCTCGFGLISEDESEEWHAGVYDMDLNTELQPCAACYEEHSEHNHQWLLTLEEEALIDCWRTYRSEFLDHFSEKSPYKYTITVELNGLRTMLMSRDQQAVLSGTNFMGEPEKNVKHKPN